MTVREVVIVSGVRTAIGDYNGALKDIAPSALGAAVVRESVKRAGIDAAEVGHIVMGNVIQTEPRDMYLARVAAMEGGLPKEVPALTVNRLCGSAVQAIISSAQAIMLGDCDIAIGGGAESMTRSAYMLPQLRFGQRMGDAVAYDSMVGVLNCPFGNGHMGTTAERMALRWNLSREDQDAFSVESHRRAAAAIAAGRFKDQILPIELKSRKGVTIFDTDEHPRADTTMESLGKLKPAFQKDGSVTAGNASSVNDGAAAVVMMERKQAEARGLKPLGRIVGYTHSGVEPELMGFGPVPAVRSLLAKTGVSIRDIDVVESNEAFAAQALAVAKDLEFDPAKTNPNGGAVALGHPVGATGAIITVKALYELARVGGKYALVTMCIGGGQGIALLLARD